jgi:hypothetical protein
MGHTSLTGSTLTNTFASNVQQGKGSLATVRNAASFAIPATAAGGYFTINLDTPFYYNGVDNLVVEFVQSGACSGNISLDAAATAGNYTLWEELGNPTGALYDEYLNMKFNFAGGNNIAVYATGSGNYYPFTTTTSGQKVQQLYLASEINGSGPITGIAFPMGTVTTASAYTINVKLGHTNLTALTNTYANNFNVGTPTTVASALSYSVPAGVPVGSYIWVPIPNGTFTYDGINNLIVEVEVTTASGQVARQYNSLTGRRLYSSAGALTGSVDNVFYGIKIRFAGGTMDVILPGTGTFVYPFNSANNNKSQHLYMTAELGTKGTITKVARRLVNNSTASDYNSFVVVLGYTTNTTLGTTFSANMTGAQTVYSGTFSVPAGLKAGDWVEIPLSTPFAYDGTRNLVIQMSTLHGTANNYIVDHSDVARYPSRESFATSDTTDTASTIDDWLAEVRLTVQ